MADAIGQFQEVNAIVQRLAGVTGQLFKVAYGERCLGGVVMTWDYPSGEALAAFEAASATDTAWTELVTRVVAADSPWVLPLRASFFARSCSDR